MAANDHPAPILRASDLWVEPQHLHPREWFTITVVLHSELSQPVSNARLDLDISGPSGHYSFPLSIQGLLPTPGVSAFQVTPDQLADSCEKRYLIAPTELFRAPGVYAVRATLFDAVSVQGQ